MEEGAAVRQAFRFVLRKHNIRVNQKDMTISNTAGTSLKNLRMPSTEIPGPQKDWNSDLSLTAGFPVTAESEFN